MIRQFFEKLRDDNMSNRYGKTLPARESWLKTKYGERYGTDNDRLKTFFEELNYLIEVKRANEEYECAKRIPDDLSKYVNDIIGNFKDAGYMVIDLMGHEGIKKHVVYISWDYDFTTEFEGINTNTNTNTDENGC